MPEEHVKFLEENRIKWFKVSAKQRFNVTEAIIELAKEVMKKEPKAINQKGSNVGLAESHHRHESKSKCCGN